MENSQDLRENYINSRAWLLESRNVNGDDCILFHGGIFYEPVSKEYLKKLIGSLKKSLKNHEEIVNLIKQINDRENDEISKYSTKKEKVFIPKKGFVYVLKCNRTGYFKIGCTSQQVSERFKQLKTANADIEILYFFKTENINEEKHFHEKFKEKKVSGEWFDLNEIDLNFICDFYSI